MHAVRNRQLLTFRCPRTTSDSSPAVRWIHFSIVSLLSFCYVTDDMESRSQWQCSIKHDGAMRAHPDSWKMKVKIFSMLRRDRHYAPLYTLPSALAIPLQNTSRRRCCPSVYCIMHLMTSKNSPLFLLLVDSVKYHSLYIPTLVYVTLVESEGHIQTETGSESAVALSEITSPSPSQTCN